MVLETRSNILYRLLRLFHYSIEALHESLAEDDDNISDKLAELLQVYLPILQYATNTFGNIPVLKIPKVWYIFIQLVLKLKHKLKVITVIIFMLFVIIEY